MTPSQPASARMEIRSLRLFILFASLAAALCVSGGFLGMALRDRRLIQEEMLNRARRDFENIVLMRQWNAAYGGVFVEKKPGITSNPYLENPDITDTGGKVYTKKNPALMTRELSELLQKNLGYAFHITSLKPLNPSNRPDAEETRALQAFEQGATERSWTETLGDKTYFRYMGPLKTGAACLACHAKQGYKAGDARGGISVSFDVQELQTKLRTNLLATIGLAVLTTVLLVVSLLLLFRQMASRLREAREQLVALATLDALTGLLNHRSILQRLHEEIDRHRRSGEPLGCILLDIDHFKQVNDRFGHAAGDQVLRLVARQLRETLRPYDAVGRFGGEEFLVVLPASDHETLRKVAERLRARLTEHVQAGHPDSPQPVTASFGITAYRVGESPETFLARADRGLYVAKGLGRNRVGEDVQGRSKVAFQSPSPRRKPGSRPERTLDSGFRRNDDCDRGRHQGDFASALGGCGLSYPEGTESPMPHPEIPVLDRGFVRLIDHMGTDLTVVNAARVSFGKRKESFNGKDAELVDYLAQHEHTAPFRHAYLTFHVKAPIFVFRQWMKHRIACLRGDTEITFVDCQGKATPKLRKTLDELWALWSTGQSNGSAPDAERVARVRVMAAEGHPDREIHRQTDVDRATVRKIREGRFNHQRSARNRVRKMNLRVLNERESTFEVGHIADIVQRGVQPVYRATLADGKTLTLTTNHRVLTEKGWTTFGEAVGLEHPEDGEPRITRTCRLVTNGAEAYRDAAWLRAQRELGRGLEEMAALAGCSTHTIRKWLKVHAPRTSPGTGPTSGASTPASRWSTGRASARTA